MGPNGCREHKGAARLHQTEHGSCATVPGDLKKFLLVGLSTKRIEKCPGPLLVLRFAGRLSELLSCCEPQETKMPWLSKTGTRFLSYLLMMIVWTSSTSTTASFLERRLLQRTLRTFRIDAMPCRDSRSSNINTQSVQFIMVIKGTLK